MEKVIELFKVFLETIQWEYEYDENRKAFMTGVNMRENMSFIQYMKKTLKKNILIKFLSICTELITGCKMVILRWTTETVKSDIKYISYLRMLTFLLE